MGWNKDFLEKQKKERIGMTNYNHQGLLMKIVDYISATKVLIEFEDGYQKYTKYERFQDGHVMNPNYIRKVNIDSQKERLYEENINKEGFKMRIIEYNKSDDIIVEFLDEFHGRVHTIYDSFRKGFVKNPFKRGKYGQVTGDEFPTKIGSQRTKEYSLWRSIIMRVFEDQNKVGPCYNDVKICDEWLYFPNFVKWISSQPNYEKWKNSSKNKWHIDKDILSDKNNKIYSPDTCCLIPTYINESIAESGARRLQGKYCLGVGKTSKRFYCKVKDKRYYYDSIEEASNAYIEYKNKFRKEDAIKAFNNGDITKQVYDVLMDDNFMFR